MQQPFSLQIRLRLTSGCPVKLEQTTGPPPYAVGTARGCVVCATGLVVGAAMGPGGIVGDPVGTAIGWLLGSTGLEVGSLRGTEVKGGIVGNPVGSAVCCILGTTEVGVALGSEIEDRIVGELLASRALPAGTATGEALSITGPEVGAT